MKYHFINLMIFLIKIKIDKKINNKNNNNNIKQHQRIWNHRSRFAAINKFVHQK